MRQQYKKNAETIEKKKKKKNTATIVFLEREPVFLEREPVFLEREPVFLEREPPPAARAGSRGSGFRPLNTSIMLYCVQICKISCYTLIIFERNILKKSTIFVLFLFYQYNSGNHWLVIFC